MSTPLYDALVTKVRSWANRDSSVLTDDLIRSFLDYAADYCYRNLRIPALEHTFVYNPISSNNVDENVITLPSDLSELIQFGKTNAEGKFTAYDERASLASMQDKNFEKAEGTFARKGRALIFHPAAELNDRFEVYYYRRLPDLDAVYTVNQTNVDAGLCTQVDETTAGAVQVGNLYYLGNEVPNWLRDDNERILVFGAVSHALEYLGEDERAEKFFNKQKEIILELNQEEIKRKAKGGSIVTAYSDVAQF